MLYDPKKHDRRSIRLYGYDYARPGAYFVAVCVQGHACLLGSVAEDAIRLSAAGKMIDAVWQDLPGHYPGVDLDTFVVMPNHIHGLIVLTGDSADPADPSDPDVGASLVDARNISPTRGRAPTRGAPTAGSNADTEKSNAGDSPLSLGEVVGAFKSITTVRYIDGVKTAGWPPFPGRLWQRNYYEHVIRGRRDLERIRRYIAENPLRWHFDRYHPDHKS